MVVVELELDGVVVSGVTAGSEAEEKGFQPGTVIIAVSNDEVETPDDVAAGIVTAREAGRESVLFLVTDGRGQRFVTLNTEQDGYSRRSGLEGLFVCGFLLLKTIWRRSVTL